MTPRRRRMVAMTGGLVCLVRRRRWCCRPSSRTCFISIRPRRLPRARRGRRRLRVGGLVEQGSVRRTPGSLEVRFDVTDLERTITVAYAGVLPDLFREGQGVVAHGSVVADGLFEADEVLARHDENYMPPEVAEMLEERGHPPDASLP